MSVRHLAASVVVLAFAGAAFAQTVPAPAAKPASASSTAATASQGTSGVSRITPVAETSTTIQVTQTGPSKPGDATAGQGKAAVCGACHGMDGNSTDPQYPRLAGQNEQYIAHQLAAFKSGARSNPIMLGFASALQPQDMNDIGAYFAKQKPVPGVADEALAGTGGKLFREGDRARNIPACMACHGPDGHGNPGAIYPQLAGQHADYVQKTLTAWHDGTSWGKDDPHAQIMKTIAQRLTPADIAAVSSYVEGLHTAQPGEATAGPEAPAPAAAGGAGAPANPPGSAATQAVTASAAAQPGSASTTTGPAVAGSDKR